MEILLINCMRKQHHKALEGVFRKLHYWWWRLKTSEKSYHLSTIIKASLVLATQIWCSSVSKTLSPWKPLECVSSPDPKMRDKKQEVWNPLLWRLAFYQQKPAVCLIICFTVPDTYDFLIAAKGIESPLQLYLSWQRSFLSLFFYCLFNRSEPWIKIINIPSLLQYNLH